MMTITTNRHPVTEPAAEAAPALATARKPRPAKRPGKKAQQTPIIVYVTEDAMRGGLNQLVTLSLEIAESDAEHQNHIATLNAAQADLLTGKRAELGVLENSIAIFCREHRPQLFPDEDKAKSKDYENARIGFRTTPHSVKLVTSKDTEAAVAIRLDTLAAEAEEADLAARLALSRGQVPEPVPPHAWLSDFVTWKPTLDKDRLLEARPNLTPEQLHLLESLGLRFAQGENFYIEPKPAAADRLTTPTEAAA